jgi:hypothetical protein
MYEKYVKMPETEEEISALETVYAKMGFPGAICSSDFTHVEWGACPAALRNDHVGKSGRPTLTYSMCCSHDTRILNVAAGMRGAENDKIAVRFDGLITRLRFDEVFTNFSFLVNVEGVELIRKRGVYAIVDGGYCRWRCLQGVSDVSEWREHFLKWSRMMECVRKDIECLFGRMKIRFGILKAPIMFRDKEVIDSIVFLCAALHNKILAADGIDGYLADDNNWLRPRDMEADEAEDNAVFDRFDARMTEAERAAAATAVGVGRAYLPRNAVIVHGDDADAWAVQDAGYHSLRDLLARHFVKAWEERRVQWPKRFKDICT